MVMQPLASIMHAVLVDSVVLKFVAIRIYIYIYVTYRPPLRESLVPLLPAHHTAYPPYNVTNYTVVVDVCLPYKGSS